MFLSFSPKDGEFKWIVKKIKKETHPRRIFLREFGERDELMESFSSIKIIGKRFSVSANWFLSPFYVVIVNSSQFSWKLVLEYQSAAFSKLKFVKNVGGGSLTSTHHKSDSNTHILSFFAKCGEMRLRRKRNLWWHDEALGCAQDQNSYLT